MVFGEVIVAEVPPCERRIRESDGSQADWYLYTMGYGGVQGKTDRLKRFTQPPIGHKRPGSFGVAREMMPECREREMVGDKGLEPLTSPV